MLRANLEDAAVAAAKAWSHSDVESRHVVFAICRLFHQRAECQAIQAAARDALEPTGSALTTPTISAGARAVLDACLSESAAVAIAVARIGEAGQSPARDTATGTGHAAAPGARSAHKHESEPASSAAVEDTSAVLAELDALIGLTAVKDKVRQTIAVVQANLERQKAGLPIVNPGLHLVFAGPPGTGKTTVARLVARLYKSAGALPGANFTEVTRGDLIAGYVGQTALRTQQVIDRTRPGVLFIDEAYSLTATHGSDYASECVATLVKNMEDYRGDFAVIAAGYGDQMAEFVHSNPGLRSRFKTFIDFPDYAASDLVQIFERFARHAQVRLATGVIEKASHACGVATRASDFGNARFARSLWEQAYTNMAVRAAADGRMTIDELAEVIPDDITVEVEPSASKQKRVGFTAPSRGEG